MVTHQEDVDTRPQPELGHLRELIAVGQRGHLEVVTDDDAGETEMATQHVNQYVPAEGGGMGPVEARNDRSAQGLPLP